MNSGIEGVDSGTEGVVWSSEEVSSMCVVRYMRGTNVQNASYQHCEHPGLPGVSSVCNVLVPWTYPSPARGTGVHCGTAKGPLGFRSSGPMTVKPRFSGFQVSLRTRLIVKNTRCIFRVFGTVREGHKSPKR